MKKITRQAQVLMFAIMIVIFLVAAFLLFKPGQESKVENNNDYSVGLVAENKKIISTYIDAISPEKSSNVYKEYNVVLEKGMKIGDYTLSQEQSFAKYIKAVGPDGKEVLSSQSKQATTHYAYSMLLIGDIQEKTNLTTKEKTYVVTNARITYNKIPIVLLSNENSVAIANSKKTKEKIMNLQDFINSLKNIEKRDDIISW